MATSNPIYTGTCDTMTFEEAYEAITTGKPFNVIFRMEDNGVCGIIYPNSIGAANGVIEIEFLLLQVKLYWTSDGISSVDPSSNA